MVFFIGVNSLFSSDHPVNLFLAARDVLGGDGLLVEWTGLVNVLGTFISLESVKG